MSEEEIRVYGTALICAADAIKYILKAGYFLAMGMEEQAMNSLYWALDELEGAHRVLS